MNDYDAYRQFLEGGAPSASSSAGQPDGDWTLAELHRQNIGLRRREAIQAFTVDVAGRALRGEAAAGDRQQLLEQLARVAGLTGVVVWPWRPGAESVVPTSQWTAPGIPLGRRELIASGLDRWREAFNTDQAVTGRVAQLPPAEQIMLRWWGVRSMVATPINQNGQLDSVVVFEDALTDRAWPAEEIGALRQAAELLMLGPGAAVTGGSAGDLAGGGMAQVGGVAVKAIGPDGMICCWNRGSELLHGYSAGEAIGRDYVDLLVPPEMRRLAREVTRQALASGETPASHEARLLRKDGSGVSVWSSSQVLTLPDGQRRVVWVDVDLAELKRSHDQQDIVQQQLYGARKMEMIGHLIGGVAHHYNNALTVIQGNGEIIRKKWSDDRKLMELIDQVLEAAVGSAQLTSQLLSYTRMDTHESAEVDVHKTAADVVEALSADLGLETAIQTDLRADPSVIMADEAEVRSALMNLGLNACEAVSDGGDVRIDTDVVALDEDYCTAYPHDIEPGAYVRISIVDSGAGMEEQTLQRAFEPFFTTKPFGQGHGLGLASVYGCVKSHKGAIKLSSAPGKGSRADVFLPLADQSAAAGEAQAGGPAARGAVMVVDDEEATRETVTMILNSAEYKVQTFADGAEAIDHYAQHVDDVSLVILDMIMPEMNGQETLAKLKQINPDVKVLLASGFMLASDVQSILDAGALGFLAKPYQAQEVLRLVTRVIRQP
ncbi:MAG: hybrid sensor histidine kinase/response regulator [Planctomycetota bacterium]